MEPQQQFSFSRKLIRSLLLRLNREHDNDEETRDSLSRALQDQVMAGSFDWIEFVMPDSKQVVYTVFVDDTLKTFRQGFAQDDNGAVTLLDDAVEGEMVRTFQPFDDSPQDATASSSSNSVGTTATSSNMCECTHDKGDQTMKDNEDLIKKVLESNSGLAADEAVLQSMSTAGLESMLPVIQVEQSMTEEEAQPEPMEVVSLAEPNLTEEQWLAAAPASFKRWMNATQTSEESEKVQLISHLSGKTMLSDDELKGRSLSDLRIFSSAVPKDSEPDQVTMAPTPRNFSTTPVVSFEQPSEYKEPVDPYAQALEKRRAAQTN